MAVTRLSGMFSLLLNRKVSILQDPSLWSKKALVHLKSSFKVKGMLMRGENQQAFHLALDQLLFRKAPERVNAREGAVTQKFWHCSRGMMSCVVGLYAELSAMDHHGHHSAALERASPQLIEQKLPEKI
jgi:hypothetical protein